MDPQKIFGSMLLIEIYLKTKGTSMTPYHMMKEGPLCHIAGPADSTGMDFYRMMDYILMCQVANQMHRKALVAVWMRASLKLHH